MPATRHGTFTAALLAASVQDRDGELVDWARTILATVVYVVRKPEGQHGFAVIPRCWCVERTLAWLTAHAASPATTNATPPPPKP